MGWLFVLLASCLEVVGVVGLKKFSMEKNVWNTVLFLGGFTLSFTLLYTSFNYIQMSVAYSVWVGLGTAAAVLINMIFFNESKRVDRIIGLVIIIVGVVGLKLVS